MGKFKIEKTLGGNKILSLHGPDESGSYAGVILRGGLMVACRWDKEGRLIAPLAKAPSDQKSAPIGEGPSLKDMAKRLGRLEGLVKKLDESLDERLLKGEREAARALEMAERALEAGYTLSHALGRDFYELRHRVGEIDGRQKNMAQRLARIEPSEAPSPKKT